MSELVSEISQVNIEDELKQSYLDYAMSVIVGRALPDVRDGLKPVHRRVLFAMNELNNDWNKPYKKSARIVGDVIGKYHPHGDTAVYDAIVRLAQPFSMRYMLVDGQGNFGSIDGDSAAAMRYTEVRMSKITHQLLADLDKDTVDFQPNYDGNELIPEVLPTRVPTLLVNGSSGIAVGMATNIPPHNLGEVCSACIALIDNPEATVEELMKYIPGPDFPTGAIINGRGGIIRAYKTGRGRVVVRAKTHVEDAQKGDKQSIIIDELPYMVNKARLIERIAEHIKDKRIEGISGLRDESDKDGMRVVIELRRGESPDIVLNNLYAQTAMQNVFGINMVALTDGRPAVMNLKQVLEAFVRHRREVVTRRTVFELKKARDRAHILEGLGVSLVNIEEIIQLIRKAKTPQEAKAGLMAKSWEPGLVKAMLEKSEDLTRPEELPEIYGLHKSEYHLSPEQAQAILDLRLHRLTGLEQEKIISEYEQQVEAIRGLLEILNNAVKLMDVIREELDAVVKEFNDERRTEILENEADLNIEDLIEEEDVVVTLSHHGYVKTQSLDTYKAQRRGGRGKAATKMKDEDFIEKLVVANTHDTVLCFSNRGKLYWLKTYQIPQASRTSRGKPIVNLLPLQANERVSALLSLREYTEDRFVFMSTSKGLVKKVRLTDFSRPRANGIIALELKENDYLVNAEITNGSQDVMLFTDAGKVIRFNESTVRPMGRTARGVRGVKLQDDQLVVSMISLEKDKGMILTATEKGYGKRTKLEEYRISGRGGQGVISIIVNSRNGKVVGAIQVVDGAEVMLITNRGTLVRTKVDEISVVGRNTQGVRLISLSGDEKLVEIEPIEDIKEEDTKEEDSSDE